jgi:hypothetical protein
MNHHSGQFYVHRPNRDGSYDSICTRCYATVASARNETELSMHETTHICIPDWPYRAFQELQVGR